LPTFRFGKVVRVTGDTRAFLDVEFGATREGAPEGARQNKHANELEAARRQIERQRRLLARKEREITDLKMRLSILGNESKRPPETTVSGRVMPGAQSGALPDFLIIGAQKAGTTYLYHLLTQHPSVESATAKEVHYFDVHFSKGVDWYRSHFPRPVWREGRKIMTGEASPYYLFHPHAARRAADAVPQAKLIVLLRNPVDRAYSDYQHKYREGREPLKSFQEAIEAEGHRLSGEREKMLAHEDYASPNYRKFSYVSRGVYVDQLEEWRKYFDEDQFLVLKSEDFFGHPKNTLASVHEFLGLPPWEVGELDEEPEESHKGSYVDLNPTVRERLETYFEPHNRRLYELLGVDFGW
jgi:Sulfotransferase domain